MGIYFGSLYLDDHTYTNEGNISIHADVQL
jgi:hypothetical protein